MAYTPCYPTKRNWANLPSESSPINETNLNAMDNAIYTNDGRIVELSGRLDSDETALGNKVDKVAGKGLSTNDYTDAEKTKLAGIETGANKTIVDSSLSGSSTNPVQNKVVKSALDGKSTVSIADTLPTGDTIANLTIDGTTTAIKAPLVEVDDELSTSSTNPVQNKIITEALREIMPEETAEGNPISISDGSNVIPAKLAEVTFLPKQDLHGYDSPWVGGAGKNKLLTTLANIKSINNSGVWTDNVYVFHGVTFTILLDDSGDVIGIKCNNTASGNADLYIQNNFSADTNYILNGCPSGGSSSTYALRGTGGVIDTGSGGNISSGTTPSVYIRINDTYNANNLIFYPMIRLSSVTDATFAPYENICPISGWTELNLVRTGKNLLDINAYDDEHGYYNVNGQFSASSSYNLYTVKVVPETTYTISGNFAGIITYWDKDLAFLSGVNQGSGFSKTFTTPQNCEYIRKSILISSIDGTQMLELGSTATAYEAYQGQTYTESLGSTYYGGKVTWNNDGTVTADISTGIYTFTGDEQWVQQTGYPRKYYSYAKLVANSALLPVDNHYSVPIITSIGSFNIPYLGLENYNYSMCIASDGRIGITSDLKKESDTLKDIQVCYELATHISLTLTAEQITLLKGKNVLWSDSNGNIKLTYSADIKAWVESQLSNS